MPDLQEKTENEKAVAPIRTYQSDVEEALQGGGGSLAKIAIAENERRTKQPISLMEDADESSRTAIIAWISAGLLVLAAAIFTAAYFLRGFGQTPVPVSPQSAPIIISDAERTVSIAGLSRDGIISALQNETQNDKITLSSVVRLKLADGNDTTGSQISASQLLQKLNSRAPDELIRSLGDNFLFGLHALNVNQPFLVFKTDYYQSAFAGMIAWEKDLADDLGPIFIPASASEGQTVLQPTFGQFQDLTVKNQDARALYGPSGSVILLYAFPDKSTIVITTNTDTLDAVSARLLASKLVR